MDAGDIAAFIAAGASVGALVTSLWTAWYTTRQAARLERVRWSRERLADAMPRVLRLAQDRRQRLNAESVPPNEELEVHLQELALRSSPRLSRAALDLADVLNQVSHEARVNGPRYSDKDWTKAQAKYGAALERFQRAVNRELGLH